MLIVFLFQYKQLATHKSDLASLTCNQPEQRRAEKDETISFSADENNYNSNTIRYIVTNTKRPDILPKIEFPKNPEQLVPPEMRYLQPSMLPKFMELRETPENIRWEIKENITK